MVNPEIVALREAIHDASSVIGRASKQGLGSDSDDEEARSASATVFEQLASLRGAVRALEGQETAVETLSRTLEAVCEEVNN